MFGHFTRPLAILTRYLFVESDLLQRTNDGSGSGGSYTGAVASWASTALGVGPSVTDPTLAVPPQSPPPIRNINDSVQPHNAPFEFAACLLLKDDNHLLPEWLAYHYETLPLRRLIVGLDPFSVTDPTPIFDAYRNIGLNITLWRDHEYMYNGSKTWERSFAHRNANDAEKFKGYLWRQRVLLLSCTRQLQRENRTWTTFLDTDEFLSFNPYRPGEGNPYDCTGKLPYSIVRQQQQQHQQPQHCENANTTSPLSYCQIRSRLPTIGGRSNSTVAHLLHSSLVTHELIQLEQSLHVTQYLQSTHANWCWVLPRYMFGAWESDPIVVNTPSILPSSDFDPQHFRTLRFRKSKYMPFGCMMMPGKPILDVSRAPPPNKYWDIGNPHKPHRACHPGVAFVSHFSNVLRVHHYTGTKEEYLIRRGPGLEFQFEDRNNVSGVRHDVDHADSIVGWLSTFANRVGVERAYDLTMGLRKWALADAARAFARARGEGGDGGVNGA